MVFLASTCILELVRRLTGCGLVKHAVMPVRWIFILYKICNSVRWELLEATLIPTNHRVSRTWGNLMYANTATCEKDDWEVIGLSKG